LNPGEIKALGDFQIISGNNSRFGIENILNNQTEIEDAGIILRDITIRGSGWDKRLRNVILTGDDRNSINPTLLYPP
jgi:hypothetical protein